MPNVIDSLFDSVLSGLKPTQPPLWPNLPYDREDEQDSPIEVPQTSNDNVISIDEFETTLDVVDAIERQRAKSTLTDEEREAIDGGIREEGFDALAFYKSKRFAAMAPYPGKWGIFYLQPALSYLAIEISSQYPTWMDSRRLALEFLRAHERFHYQMDVQTLLLEAVLGKQLYAPIRHAFRRRSSQFVEEALANRQAWDWSKKGVAGIQEFAYDFMMLQPDAYARFEEPRLALAAEWAAITVDFAYPGSAWREDLAHLVEAQPKGLLRPSLCPEYVIYPANFSTWFSPDKAIPPVKTIKDSDVRKLISSRYKTLEEPWKETKAKILEDRTRYGLNFKRWRKDNAKNAYSVRVDGSFRAHMRHEGNGNWVAYGIGSHSDMGHG